MRRSLFPVVIASSLCLTFVAGCPVNDGDKDTGEGEGEAGEGEGEGEGGEGEGEGEGEDECVRDDALGTLSLDAAYATVGDPVALTDDVRAAAGTFGLTGDLRVISLEDGTDLFDVVDPASPDAALTPDTDLFPSFIATNGTHLAAGYSTFTGGAIAIFDDATDTLTRIDAPLNFSGVIAFDHLIVNASGLGAAELDGALAIFAIALDGDTPFVVAELAAGAFSGFTAVRDVGGASTLIVGQFILDDGNNELYGFAGGVLDSALSETARLPIAASEPFFAGGTLGVAPFDAGLALINTGGGFSGVGVDLQGGLALTNDVVTAAGAPGALLAPRPECTDAATSVSWIATGTNDNVLRVAISDAAGARVITLARPE